MVKLHQLKSDLRQSDWEKACRKLGLVVKTSQGIGSHISVYMQDGRKDTPITILCHMTKIISQALYKTLLDWGFAEKEIDKALK